MKKLVIQPATKPDRIPDAIREILKQDGLYIASMGPGDPRLVPTLVRMGKIYSMRADQELDLSKFIPGTIVEGPIVPQP